MNCNGCLDFKFGAAVDECCRTGTTPCSALKLFVHVAWSLTITQRQHHSPWAAYVT
jgi:hypothetical protein